MALYLPWLEIACGVALIVGWLSAGALTILSFMLLVFIAALLSAWWRVLDLNCGCFGKSTEDGDYLWPIVRDLALLAGLRAMCVVGVFGNRTSQTKTTAHPPLS